MAQFSWKNAPDLMDRLSSTQNAPCNCVIDIMTFAGFCTSREQLETHVSRYEAREAAAIHAAAYKRAGRRSANV
jgi:hypothetical protein